MQGAMVGPNYSVGFLPDEAAQLNQVQQQYGQQFENYTNPFLNMRGIQQEVLPWMQQAMAQKQQAFQQQNASQQLELEKARQQMAQTAQNTLLPLQANQMQAQTANFQAEAARANFLLDQQQQGAPQVADLASELSKTNPADPNAGNAIVAKYAQALTLPAGQDIFNRWTQNADQLNQIKTKGQISNWQDTGGSDVFNPQYQNMTSQQYSDSLKQQPGESDLDFATRKIYQPQGYAKGVTQHQQAIFQAQNALTLQDAKSGAMIDAARLRALGKGITTGQVDPDYLEQWAPGLSTAAIGAISDPKSTTTFTADPRLMRGTSKFSNDVQNDLMKKWLSSTTDDQRDQLKPTMAVVFPDFAIKNGMTPPVYDPSFSNELDAINSARNALSTTMKTNAADPNYFKTKTGFWHDIGEIYNWDDPDYSKSQFQKDTEQMNDLKSREAELLKQHSTNFQNQTTSQEDQETPNLTNFPIIQQPQESPEPARQSFPNRVQNASPGSEFNITDQDLKKLPYQYQMAYRMAKANPTDPRSGPTIQKVRSMLANSK